MQAGKALRNLASVPVWRGGAPPPTMDAREAALAGVEVEKGPPCCFDPAPALRDVEQARAFVLGLTFSSKSFASTAEFVEGMTVRGKGGG